MSVIREELGNATGHEALAPTSVTGITTTLITPTSGSFKDIRAVAALITVETNPMRFMIHGSNPSATTGHKMDAGQSYVIMGEQNVANFRCIDTATGASAVMVTVFHTSHL